MERLKGLGRWFVRNLADVIFAVSLIGLGIGFGLAWLPLGIIVPCLILMALAVTSQVIPRKPGKGDSPDA